MCLAVLLFLCVYGVGFCVLEDAMHIPLFPGRIPLLTCSRSMDYAYVERFTA